MVAIRNYCAGYGAMAISKNLYRWPGNVPVEALTFFFLMPFAAHPGV
jgi:hypothetical protein